MKKRRNSRISCVVFAMLITSTLSLVSADDTRLAEVEKKVDALVNDLEKFTFKDVFAPVGEQKYGMGPAASKIYFKNQGVSIGGYGEMIYQNYEEGSNDSIDFLRGVVYIGYKFNDNWLVNVELEFEHASTDKSGASSVEFAYLDYLHSDMLNFRGGLVLVPMGLVNELHEPTVFSSVNRPLSENKIIPSTWRENGVGVFGQNHIMQYKLFVVNGFDASGFSSGGLRGGRQKGSNAKAENFALVGRLDLTPVNGLILGVSAYRGKSSQGMSYLGEEIDVDTTLIDAHFDFNWEYIYTRGLYVQAELSDISELNRIKNPLLTDDLIDSIGEDMQGWYLEFGIDMLKFMTDSDKSLKVFVRHEEVNTQDSIASGFKENAKNNLENFTFGISFKPIEQIVIKADYQWVENSSGSENNQANLGMGYIF